MILQWVPYTHHPESTKNILLFLLLQLTLRPSSIIIILLSMRNGILTCWIWRQFLTQPSLAFPTRAFCHAPDPLFSGTCFPVPFGQKSWRVEIFWSGWKPRKHIPFRVQTCLAEYCLSCNVTLHAASFSETSPETTKLTPPCAHSWEPRWPQNMSEAIPKTEKIPGNSVKFLLSFGGGSG